MKRKEFTTKDKEDKDITLYVLKPTQEHYRLAKKASTRAFF